MLRQEARGLLTRLADVEPFATHIPVVPAAAISPAAQTAIEQYLVNGRRELNQRLQQYLRWVRDYEGGYSPAMEAQRRLTVLRLRFNAVLAQFDIFSDVLTQRSEHGFGVFLAGLDEAASDALTLPDQYYRSTPVITYLDRGLGGAIRRTRTRLPGGGKNPVAIVRIPRERMVGSGIASSLVHEVGHQGLVLLDLINSLRPVLQGMRQSGGREASAWGLWERWIMEILADFWSIAKVGVASTLGLMSLASLPRAFVFRLNSDDPHPAPWVRVKLSCAIGRALYPHPQWDRLESLWESYYPPTGLDIKKRGLLATLEATIPGFVTFLVNHRPKALRGKSLREVMPVEERQPARLAGVWRTWRTSLERMSSASPTLAFAVIGQARADGNVSPEEESRIISELLRHWALRRALTTSARCAKQPTKM
jgi:hypothetical protein